MVIHSTVVLWQHHQLLQRKNKIILLHLNLDDNLAGISSRACPWAERSKKKCQTMKAVGYIGEAHSLLSKAEKNALYNSSVDNDSCLVLRSAVETVGASVWRPSHANRPQVSCHGPRGFIYNVIFLGPSYFISIWSRYFIITTIFRARGSPDLIWKGAWYAKPDFSKSGSGGGDRSWWGRGLLPLLPPADLWCGRPSSPTPCPLGEQCHHCGDRSLPDPGPAAWVQVRLVSEEAQAFMEMRLFAPVFSVAPLPSCLKESNWMQLGHPSSRAEFAWERGVGKAVLTAFWAHRPQKRPPR